MENVEVTTYIHTYILEVVWGRMKVAVNSEILTFKDCKVWPVGAKEWDWRLTGTRHFPGIQPADIEEILANGVNVMILSRGMELRLQTCPETEQLLVAKGIPYHIEETTQAVRLFNQLVEKGQRVGGVFHSTC